MLKILNFIAIFLMLVSCTNSTKNTELPANILPSNEMADVLVDVFLLESAMNIGSLEADSILKSSTPPTKQLLNKHNLTYDEYKQNIKFYTLHLDSFNSTLYLVVNKINEIQAEISSQISLQNDSINNANK
jgi:hypothetical protein